MTGDDLLNLPIEVLKISNRTRNALKLNNIREIKDLVNSSKRALSFCSKIGEQALVEIEESLKVHDIKLKDR